MSRKKKNNVLRISSVENTLSHMPHYNAYQGGYGSHGDKKYNRRKMERQFRKEMREAS